MSVGRFLDSRLVVSDHLVCPDLYRKAIKEIKITQDGHRYNTMLALPWQDKQKLNDTMFETGVFEKNIRLEYLDIPSLHTFDNEGCKFFEALANIESSNIGIFKNRSV